MTEWVNKIHNKDFLDNELPDKSVQLIIADPPYYKVKGEFDFVWRTFEEYLHDVDLWAKECKRVLADNGTLFWYGSAKKIAYTQIILDKYFYLVNNLVWDKGSFMGLEKSSGLRSFAPCTERILMCSNEVERTGLEEIKLNVENFQPLRQYFKQLQGWIAMPKSKIIKNIGQSGDHCFRWGSTQWDLPTTETYSQLIEVFDIKQWDGFKEYETLRQEYETLRQEYETLRQEYETLRRPFDNTHNNQEVLRYNNEQTRSQKFKHDTVKPEALTSALIETCSRPNDLVLAPFAGSGTECAMAAKLGRRFIGYDIEKKYCEMATKRAEPYLLQTRLF